ncbi:transcriptional activator rinB-like protein [Staphylococcus aureus]|uniref:Transcriptional activator rinB-like protein n=1 Tax=Staphylococcus aureus TaxID=1280 RepID=A0A380DSX9_STAAU|nr:transcriptional activator rinB-like protein [Staphylococcus aureus]
MGCLVVVKEILRLLFLLAMYELGKYVTEQVYIMMTANDDVEAPVTLKKSELKFHGNRFIIFELIILMCLAIALECCKYVDCHFNCFIYIFIDLVK